MEDFPQDDQFERLASYITAKRHYTETFSPSDIVIGNDIQGIDGVAGIVNGVFITDPNDLEELVAAGADYLKAIPQIQAKRSPASKRVRWEFRISVGQFFTPNSVLSKTPPPAPAIGIMRGIDSSSSKFKRENPSLGLYYVTTGRWAEDPVLEQRRQRIASDLLKTRSFSDLEFHRRAGNSGPLSAVKKCDLQRVSSSIGRIWRQYPE